MLERHSNSLVSYFFLLGGQLLFPTIGIWESGRRPCKGGIAGRSYTNRLYASVQDDRACHKKVLLAKGRCLEV